MSPTGSFGSGKTTAIRRLMANKPEQEPWMVVLNEFTDAGLDALSVAEVARGQFDVRLVATGCLCCVGELEFNNPTARHPAQFQAGSIVDRAERRRPRRRGCRHPGALQGKLNRRWYWIAWFASWMRPRRRQHLRVARGEQVVANPSRPMLLLLEAGPGGESEQQAFAKIAAAQYPAKGLCGNLFSTARLPPESLQHFTGVQVFHCSGTFAASAAGPDDLLHRLPAWLA